MLWPWLAFLPVLLLQAQPPRKRWSWHQTTSVHFSVSHQAMFMPPGFLVNVEKMHSRLLADLAAFTSWMGQERVKLYVYEDQSSYLSGEFEPPAWSNGIAIYDRKTVAVYDQPNRKKLYEVLSHETTHMLFEGYWAERGRARPLTWLNEGLAMLEESENAMQPGRSDWYQAMAYLSPSSILPIERILETAPSEQVIGGAQAANWYVQAYSLVYFLYREHPKLQFRSFCSALRDGKELKNALWASYRFKSLPAFEKAWRAWLVDPKHRKRVEQQQPKTSANTPAPEFKPIQFKPYR